MAYPTSLDNLNASKTNDTLALNDHATHHNALATAINAIEAELGLSPSGSAATVAALLVDLVTSTELSEAADAALASANAYTDAAATTAVKTGTSYTPALGDQLNVIIELTNAGLVTVTLPNAVFAANAQIECVALGAAGAVFVAGSGASVAAPGGNLDLPQNCSAIARYRGTGAWLLSGALS